MIIIETRYEIGANLFTSYTLLDMELTDKFYQEYYMVKLNCEVFVVNK